MWPFLVISQDSCDVVDAKKLCPFFEGGQVLWKHIPFSIYGQIRERQIRTFMGGTVSQDNVILMVILNIIAMCVKTRKDFKDTDNFFLN